MQGTCYSIEKCDGQWIVSACGSKLFICKQKKIARMIAKRAAEKLSLELDLSDPTTQPAATGPSPQLKQSRNV